MRSYLVILALCTSLSACNMAPKYQRPSLPVPSNISSAGHAEAAEVTISSVVRWQEFFPDSGMQKIITQAIENNRDLRVAVHNIEVARASYGITESAILPNINVQGSLTRHAIPAKTSPSGRAYIASQYNANLITTSYELDLFGRVKNTNEAALENYQASIEARNSAQISLIAETANTYLQWLASQKQLELANQMLRNQQQLYDIAKASYQKGISSLPELLNAEVLLDSFKADQASKVSMVAKTKNALLLLLGNAKPEELVKSDKLDQIKLMLNLPSNLPAAILLNRPDIKQAEHLLKSQNAKVGIARAAFFPSVSLTGSYGFASNALSGLFVGGAATGAWSFMPQITLPIFDMGKNQAGLEKAKAENQIALASYEKAIQSAFREVADALAERQALHSQCQAQESIVSSAQSAYKLAKARHQAGIENSISLLRVKQVLLSAEQSLVSVKQQQLANLVNLYKALGNY